MLRSMLPPNLATSEATSRSELAHTAFDRASGAPLVSGNSVRVLLDAKENYPAWLEAIRSARSTVFFENYIIADDQVGREFAEALADRARAGVKVRLIRDWLGSWSEASRHFWRELEDAGVEIRVFNPPGLASPLGWISRDHRKMIAVDAEVAFVSGLCISKRWLGVPERGITPWRDTGLMLQGPSVAWAERAFKEVWDVTGEPLPLEVLSDPDSLPRPGNVSLRILAGEPTSTDLFRLDQIIAAAAQQTLWLTDAYFVGFAPYLQALRQAARDGVDVRLLVPSTTDLPLVSPLSRAGYRPLLEAGVRVFEWNGSMIHAKTAVVDRRWARVGSSNLNLASFIGNYELDVAIEDSTVAGELADIYLRDLENSTEITLSPHRRVRPVKPRAPRIPKGSRRPPVGAVRFARAVGAAAASGTRSLGAVESSIERVLAVLLLGVAVIAFIWPAALAYPLGVIAIWFSVALILRAHRGARLRHTEAETATRPRPPGPDGQQRCEGSASRSGTKSPPG